MKLALITLLGLLSINTQARVFTGTFWEKNLTCANDPLACLPQNVEKETNFEFEYPSVNVPTEIEITGKEYLVQMFMSYHSAEVDYFSVQFTIKDLDGNIIAMCSRYEAVDTMENVPVGSCGGVNPNKDNVVAGFTISLTN